MTGNGTFTDGTFTDGWMRRFAASAAATEAELTALDQQVGDGDFGVNLMAGLDAAVRRLDATPARTDASGPLAAAAEAFLDEVGGTSGPLFGLLFQEIAAAVGEAGAPFGAAALAIGAGNGLAAIQRVGEAVPGDKTLVDALAPACEALTACAPSAEPRDALAHAAGAAWEGVRDTARLRARRGRASYVGARAGGVPDPGAVGIGLLFSSAEATVTRLADLLAAPQTPQTPQARQEPPEPRIAQSA